MEIGRSAARAVWSKSDSLQTVSMKGSHRLSAFSKHLFKASYVPAFEAFYVVDKPDPGLEISLLDWVASCSNG